VAAVGVDRVEEAPVAGEILVAQPRLAINREAVPFIGDCCMKLPLS